MSFEQLRRWRHSLLGQLYALTVLFLVLGVLYFAVLTYLRVSSADPLEMTRWDARREVSTALQNADEQPMAEYLENSEIIRRIAERNEKFRLYIAEGDQVVQFGDSPKWHGAIDFSVPRIEQLENVDDPTRCVSRGYWWATLDDEGIEASVSFRECDGVQTYTEYGGIENPIERTYSAFSEENLQLLWRQSRQTVIAAAGFVLIAGLVVFLATRSLRRVTTVASAFDADKATVDLLPEDGIPTEVLPLVRAINDMVRRMHKSQEQQKFFLATAAHEMRTPMAILRTRLEELPDSETKQVLRGDVRRLARLVEQLLQLMGVAGSEGFGGEIDLVALSRRVVAERAPLALDKGVEMELSTDIESHHVPGDENLLGVALSNLIDNAISFSSRGDVLVVRVESNGTISVQDQGPGIVAEEVDTIFEPFAKNPPNRKGHGLGLAIVKAIMSLHGGGVTAGNVRSGGARFALQFQN